MSKILKGQFVSVWEQGSVSTYAELDTEKGEVIEIQIANTKDMGFLEREYFQDRAGIEYEVCTECHSYILKTEMNPDNVGKGLHEDKVCSNPDCR